MTTADHTSDLKLTTDTPYLILTGELYGVFCEDFWENWPHYNSTALFFFVFLECLSKIYQTHLQLTCNQRFLLFTYFYKKKNPAILNLETCTFMITHKHYGQVFLSTQCHHILCCGNAVAVCANSSYDRDGIFQLIWSITHWKLKMLPSCPSLRYVDAWLLMSPAHQQAWYLQL